MVRDTAFMQRKVPLRLALITASKSDSFIIIKRPSRVMPALLTRMSMRPKVLTAASIRFFHLLGVGHVALDGQGLGPRASQAATVSWAAASFPA